MTTNLSEANGYTCLEQIEGDTVVAFVTYRVCRNKEIYVAEIYVMPSYRGQGWTRTLISTLDEMYPGHSMLLQVSPFGDKPLSTPQLISLYEKYGFEVCHADSKETFMSRP